MMTNVKRFLLLVLLVASAVAAADPAPEELFRQGHFARAQAGFQLQVERQTEAGKQWTREHAEAHFNLGAASAATGFLAEAVLSFRQALAIFEKLHPEDTLDTALVLEGLASVQIQQEDLASAQQNLDKALAIRSKVYPQHHPQMARLYAQLGNLAHQRGEFEKADELYYRGLMAYRKIHGNVDPVVAEIIQNIGTLYTDTGQFQADIMYRQAADVVQMLVSKWHPLRAVSLTNFGRLRWKEGLFTESEEYLRLALAIHDHLGTRSNPDLAACLTNLGRTLLAQDRPAEAAEILDRAAVTYENAWWRAGAGSDRSLAVMSPYPLLAAARLLLGRDQAALQAFQSHQGRLASLSRRLQELPPGLAARRDSLVSTLNLHEENLAQLESHDAPREEVAEARSALADTESRWLTFQAEAAPMVLPGGDHPRDADSARRIPAVSWFTVEIRPDDHLGWGVALSQDGKVHWAPLDPGNLLTSPETAAIPALATQEIREAILAGSQDLDAQLKTLRAYALDPVLAYLNRPEALVVVPSDFMAGFPVELLLPENVQVTYSPVLETPAAPAASRKQGHPRRVLVVADPPFSATAAANQVTGGALPPPDVLRSALGGNRESIENLPPLAGTRREADALARLFPRTEVLLGSDASEDHLRQLASEDRLRKFDILHLATHALIDAERPGRSALVLSQQDRGDEPSADGLLTVHEINRTWRLDARLVTMSACATGLGRRIDGEGYLGFSQALLAVGAEHVMVSLWPVDDRATALLMERFYGNLAAVGTTGESLDPAAALSEARQWLRTYKTPAGTQPFVHPRYWAGFVLFGGA